ncbi:hypothetical protein P775_08260 [Puniceibacterium antarcticum]|uniref:Uncharacterized protein n=1 Tax=Puniceibacterium antarcticum TaxID=1206336 RepID=A0A2G8RG61_9RHOB|nr:hypothetical protein P775_08260 [Puniceibacterium antarcticum]
MQQKVTKGQPMKCFVSALIGALLALMIMPTSHYTQRQDVCSMPPMFESWEDMERMGQ